MLNLNTTSAETKIALNHLNIEKFKSTVTFKHNIINCLKVID